MKHPARIVNLISLLTVFGLLFSIIQPVSATVQPQDGNGERRDYSPETGKLTFLGADPNKPITVRAAQAQGISPEQRSMAFVEAYGREFGLKTPGQELTVKSVNQSGTRETTRYQQSYQGIPVMGGELVVNATGKGGLLSMNGEISPDLNIDINPAIPAQQAQQSALEAVAKWNQLAAAELQATEPELWIYDSRLLKADGTPPALVWRLEVKSVDGLLPIRELVLVDAHRGQIALHFNQVDTARQGEPKTPVTQTEADASNDVQAQTGGNTWYVTTTGNDSNSCSAPDSPCLTINRAIESASAGDKVYVATGTYTGLGSVVVTITKDLSIIGGWNNDFTVQNNMSIIDGQNSRQGIIVNSGVTTTVEYFTIQNGYSVSSRGGGIDVQGNLTLNHSVVKNNIASNSNYGDGGGISVNYGTLIVNYSIIKGNFANGTYGVGGGINSINSPVTVNSSSIIGNSANYYGGGINHDGAYLNIDNSTIAGNSASGGGGIYVLNDPLTIRNSTITSNYASGYGGGVQNKSASYSSNVVIINSIVANNTAKVGCVNYQGYLNTTHHNIYGKMECGTITPGAGDQFNVDPHLSLFPVGTLGMYVPLVGSPAIDNGDGLTCLGTDQRGVIRPQGGGCDSGAYEYVLSTGPAITFSAVSGLSQVTAPNSPFALPLVVYVADSQEKPVSGVSVTFTAPASGPSGVFFNSGTNSTTVISDANGLAQTTVFTANSQTGNYSVAATVSGLAGSVSFDLSNRAWYVSLTGNDTNDCQTTLTPCLTINGAIGKAAEGDTIFTSDAIYTGSGTEVVAISKGLTISGGWDNSFTSQTGYTTIDGQNSRRGVSVSGGTGQVILSHLIIKNGYSNADGGGIYKPQGNTLIVENSIIQDNWADKSGGGIYGAVILRNSTVSANHAEGLGGIGGAGGGIESPAGSVITNSTISGNTAVGYGGGIHFIGDGTINNSTIVYNNALVAGGGIDIAVGSVSVRNTILALNTTANVGPDCWGGIAVSDHNFWGNSFSCSRQSETGAVSGNLNLGSALIGNPPAYPLLFGSQAIDAGNPTTCESLDQHGVARPVGSACDIGASEYFATGTIPDRIAIYGSSTRYVVPGRTLSPALKVVVFDASNQTVPGILVTFSAPNSGAGGKFNDTNNATSTTMTDGIGVATGGTFTANSELGQYSITASVSGISNPLIFTITNIIEYKTYSMGHSSDESLLPGALLCDQTNPVCTHGDNPDADNAHKFALDIYKFYRTQHNRNGIDNNNLPIVSSIDFGTNYDNAFWSGTQMVYGDGYPLADDIVAHELTHGVTQYESNLFYYYQSGAINESFSDIWGELYDQSNGQGTDTPSVKWLIGENAPGGAIRSMSNPPAYGDPDAITSPNYFTGWQDSGGVHTNSGVNNKAAFLLVDGGVFNGKTVTPLGAPKTLDIYYEAQVNLLTSGADYGDLYNVLYQACFNLIGQEGITAGDCQEVRDATDAVAMNAQPGSNPSFNTDAPLCGANAIPKNVFVDDLESGSSNWTFVNGSNTRWQLGSPYGDYAHSGTGFLYADDYPATVTDAKATLNAVAIPANAYLHFSHAYDFEYNSGGTIGNYDGGILEYSANGGAWTDAGPLMDYNGYKGTIYTGYGNPLGGRSGFVQESHGYISTRLNLSSLAGKNVAFRWRLGLDTGGYYLGWFVDDVRIYTCAVAPETTITSQPASLTDLTTATFSFTSSKANSTFECSLDGASYAACTSPLTYTGLSLTTHNFSVRATDSNGATDPTPASYSWRVAILAYTDVYIGTSATPVGSYLVPVGEGIRPSYAQNNGPVRVVSTNALPIIATERHAWKVNGVYSSYAEMMGLPANQLTDTYIFPWYNNATMNTELRVGNVGAGDTTITVKIAGSVVDSFPLAQNASARKSYTGVNNGPMEVSSSGGVKIIATHRFAWMSGGVYTSITELMGLPAGQLTDTYVFPWYNNQTMDTQLRIGNVGSGDTTITVKIGGSVVDTFPLAQNAGARKSYNLNAGPVEITSSGGVDIIATERHAWKVNGVYKSYAEMMGLPGGALSDRYVFPWYNNQTMSSELRVGNVGSGDTTITVKIAGAVVDTFPLAQNASARKTYNYNSGPMEVTSSGSVKIITTHRFAWMSGGIYTSITEMMGLPYARLTDTYVFPWYNNATMDTQLRIGVP